MNLFTPLSAFLHTAWLTWATAALLLAVIEPATKVWATVDCSLCEQLDSAYNKVKTGIKDDSFNTKSAALDLVCMSSPNDQNAIGVVQRMQVKAPFAAVVAVLDDFPAYAELFPDLVKVEAQPGKTPGEWTVKWTESAPVFFMSDLVHEMTYRITPTAQPFPEAASQKSMGRAVPPADAPLPAAAPEKSLPPQKASSNSGANSAQKEYRYSLKASKHLKYSEGLIVVRSHGLDRTDFLEIDFYNADWSLLKILGSGKIWSENVKQLVLSDLAVQLKAENHELSNKGARSKAEKQLDSQTVDECLQHKVEFTPARLLELLRIKADPSSSAKANS